MKKQCGGQRLDALAKSRPWSYWHDVLGKKRISDVGYEQATWKPKTGRTCFSEALEGQGIA